MEPPDFIKIGYTGSAKISDRLSQIQTGNHEKLYVWCVIALRDDHMARETEKLLHWCLRRNRLNGEWFKFTQGVNDFIQSVVVNLGFFFWGNPEEALLFEESDEVTA